MLALIAVVLATVAIYFIGKLLLKLFLVLAALAPFLLFIFIGMIIGALISDNC